MAVKKRRNILGKVGNFMFYVLKLYSVKELRYHFFSDLTDFAGMNENNISSSFKEPGG